MKCSACKRSGPGQMRRPYLIREFLSERGMDMKDLAKEMKISYVVVRETVWGMRNSRRVLRKLVEMGCPVAVLGLPADMIEKKEAA